MVSVLYNDFLLNESTYQNSHPLQTFTHEVHLVCLRALESIPSLFQLDSNLQAFFSLVPHSPNLRYQTPAQNLTYFAPY
jgi:hypothetical protein